MREFFLYFARRPHKFSNGPSLTAAHDGLLVFIKTDVTIGTYSSGFGIFKQNRENPGEIGMVGQSELVIEIQMDKKHTLPFSCLMFKFSFICNYYNIYVNILRLKFERTKLAFLKMKHSFIFVCSVPFAITETEIETRGVFRSN